jgi:hypothetical protein
LPHRVSWPDGRAFAFTIFDDTDNATRDGVAPVYDLIAALGLRTTKSVWAVAADGPALVAGQTCDDPDYRAWTLELQQQGFEIASHGASNETSPRQRVVEALDRFRDIYGHDPGSLANHADCAEALYWGEQRVSGPVRLAYNLLTRFRTRNAFRGHVEGDPLFWGDVCGDRIRYVRNFVYRDVNTLAACPVMPYHDPRRPYVRAWFAASDGSDVAAFKRCVSEPNQERLEAEGGACIVYTHLASGFWRDGRPDPEFERLLRRLAGRNGWFVPVTTLLDHIADQQGLTNLTDAQRRALEWRWLKSRIATAGTAGRVGA